MFDLLFICSCFIVCSEFPYSESFCFIGTNQFISSVRDLSCFCLVWIFTELILRTHLRAIFVLCIPFYKPASGIIYITSYPMRFSIIDVFSYEEGFHLFVFDAG